MAEHEMNTVETEGKMANNKMDTVDTERKMANKKMDTIETEGFIVKKDIFNGYTVDTKHQTFGDIRAGFEENIAGALSKWKIDGIKAVWIIVRTRDSDVISVCTKKGFDFHHAQPGYVMLTQWLPDHIENRIPGYANHYLGVAGFVVNDKNQLLVIQEKFDIGNKHWKIPGGQADKGEELADTAKREVFEETGVEAEFISVISFRHLHNFRYGCSDWYFVCLMKPITEEIKPCPHEIGDCKWVEIDEYLRDPDITRMNRFVVQCYKEGQMKHGGLCILPSSDVLNFDRKKYNQIYSIQKFER